MKKSISIAIISIILLSICCKSTVAVKALPGLVKKVTKAKSAKPFGPRKQKIKAIETDLYSAVKSHIKKKIK